MREDLPNLDVRLARLLEHWRQLGIPLNSGAPPEMFVQLQSTLGLPLPGAFRALYSEANGMANDGYDGMLFGLWPIEHILAELADPEHKAPPGARSVDFGDGLIESHRYAVALEGPHLGAVLAHWHGDGPEIAAPTLGEFAASYLATPESVFLVPGTGRAGA